MEKINKDWGCFTYDGNTTELMMKNRYLGNIYEKAINDKIVVNFMVTSNDNMNDLTMWWLQELDYGTKEFMIEIMYFGKIRKIIVKMINNLKATHGEAEQGWVVGMDLDVQYLVTI